MHTSGPGLSTCPVCRKPLHELPGVSLLLRDAVSLLFPEEAQRRRDDFCDEAGILESLSRGAERAALAAIRRAIPAEVNASDDQERTALHMAAMKGYVAVCRALLDCTGFVEATACDVHGNTALHYAAGGGHADVCQLLLQHRHFTEVNARNIFGESALHCSTSAAASSALLNSSKFLVVGGVDMRSRTALHSAALNGHTDVCSVLLEHPRFRSHAAAKDAFDCTALHVAASAEVRQVLASVLGADHNEVREIGTTRELASSNVAFVAAV